MLSENHDPCFEGHANRFILKVTIKIGNKILQELPLFGGILYNCNQTYDNKQYTSAKFLMSIIITEKVGIVEELLASKLFQWVFTYFHNVFSKKWKLVDHR